MIFSSFIHLPANFMKSFFLTAESITALCKCTTFFCIHFSVEGHLGCFQILATIDKIAMNIAKHVSLLYVGASFGYMPRTGIVRSSGRIISSFLRNYQTDFQSCCTSLQSHQQWRPVLLSPYPCQHLLSPEFLNLAILTGVSWNLRFVLICSAMMIKDVEHFLGASQPLGIPQLTILCLALYPIFK